MSTPNSQLPGSRTPEAAEAGSRTPEAAGAGSRTPEAAEAGSRKPEAADAGSRETRKPEAGSRKRRRILGAGAAMAALILWVRVGPLPDGLLDEPTPSTIVVDRTGVPLYEARSGDGTRSIKLSPAELPIE